MEKKDTRGGAREGAGRKPKADEQKLIEKLTPLEAEAHKALLNGLKNKQNWAVKLFFEYMYGKAKEFKELDIKNADIKVVIGE